MSETITIVVLNKNRPPMAQPEAFNTPAGVPLTIAAPGLLANDADADGETLSVVLKTGITAGSGTLTLGMAGLTFAPVAGFTGNATFTYRASDGIDASAPVTVTIAVAGDSVNQTVTAGATPQTVSTDAAGDNGPGATPTDPVETSVTLPAGLGGTVTIAEAAPAGTAPDGTRSSGRRSTLRRQSREA